VDLERLTEIKKAVIKAMFSDDEIMEKLVLKGGNAIDLIYGMAQRSSLDLDFSMEDDFDETKLKEISSRLEFQIKAGLSEIGYEAFDIRLSKRPSEIDEQLRDFWGGYQLKFKLIECAKKSAIENNINTIRRNASVVGPNQRKIFTIDISRFEYVKDKIKRELDGYIIYVYAPELMICEKLRSICQQMDEYRIIVKSKNKTARARDFFDIYTLQEHFKFDLKDGRITDLIRAVFAAKKVPLFLLGKIDEAREFHREDFISVKDTVINSAELKDFDYYFDYVIDICKALKPLWIE
jgi:hypothetical protein